MLIRISCDPCRLSALWTDDPGASWTLSACTIGSAGRRLSAEGMVEASGREREVKCQAQHLQHISVETRRAISHAARGDLAKEQLDRKGNGQRGEGPTCLNMVVKAKTQ
jgi:hypothetical protein